ncbi:hypothetical protein L2E82_29269 [Cichorium intybus]|uniref:Uncharacterized protein n=1 Tax=Cichorium intybus TaxID=13427 RepID=A0ACB9CXD8_CICIN|nr:hypothetical protein L2E82_29269 [Cichorium intybus]
MRGGSSKHRHSYPPPASTSQVPSTSLSAGSDPDTLFAPPIPLADSLISQATADPEASSATAVADYIRSKFKPSKDRSKMGKENYNRKRERNLEIDSSYLTPQ